MNNINQTLTRRILALSSILLIPVSPSFAQDEQGQQDDLGFSEGDFMLSEEPTPKPAPVYDNFVEAGVGYTSDNATPFTPYSGRTDDGAFPSGSFGYYRRGPWDGDDASYLEAEGERLGLKSRSLRGEAGVQGKYKLFLDYDQIPFYENRSRTPYKGVDSQSLSLPQDWESNPPEFFNSATQHFPELNSNLQSVKIKTDRKRYGGGVEWNIDKNWTALLKVRREKKDGLKPLGVAWGTTGQNAAAVVVPEPIDYETDYVDTEIGYRDKKLQFRLGYQLSMFDNRDETLSVENPYTYRGWNPAARFDTGIAEMQLAPDNKAHTFNLDGGYNFTDTTRVTANLSYSRYKQDESFLPYTANSLLSVSQDLPRGSFDGEINNTLANVEFVTRPTKQFDIKARYRYTDRDNDSSRDQYVYVRGDSENQQIGGSEVNYRSNTPYSIREHLFGADVGYRPRSGTKITVGYNYRDKDRNYAERNTTREHTGRIDVLNRFSDKLSGRAEYSHSKRDGSSYSNLNVLQDSYSDAFIDSLGDAPFLNHPLTRAYYLADMDADKITGRLTYTPTDRITLGTAGSYKKSDYDDTDVGLTDVEGWNATFDASYALNDNLILTGYYAYDRRKSDQAGWAFEGGANKLDQANDPAYSWTVDNKDKVHTVGLGINWKITKAISFVGDYNYTDATTTTDTGSGGALTADNFPDITTKIHRLKSTLGYDMTDQMSLGASYVYERFRASDWQTDDVSADTIGRVLSLEDSDEDFNNHAIMVWARYKF